MVIVSIRHFYIDSIFNAFKTTSIPICDFHIGRLASNTHNLWSLSRI